MLVLVNQKSIGRNKKIKTVPLEYQVAPTDVYALIEETVRMMVSEFTERMKRSETPLSEEQIRDLAETRSDLPAVC